MVLGKSNRVDKQKTVIVKRVIFRHFPIVPSFELGTCFEYSRRTPISLYILVMTRLVKQCME